ncbi:hypothetical protein DPMN_035114 [Dreissena polymorpha]|uniref:Uncharacterized protein n=1 Tax=Dreissena polymorpha TaxID=45954 RepID=A0A9D4M9Y0_DREPO|nr:hypothetical protein DPMN_035114 [Dreissena polymorpha]
MSDTEKVEGAKNTNVIAVEMSEKDMIEKLLASGDKISKPESEKPSNTLKFVENPKILHSTPFPLNPEHMLSSGGAIPKTLFQKFSTAQANDNDSLQENPSLNAHIQSSVPKLPMFSGDEPCPKGKVSYNEWRFEVKCLRSDNQIFCRQ